ncbi:hypothetical protein IscW_ISCW017074 [Ixodes scapularis]|uniref:WWE domain-containing protein n=1 Tax=Ixodes scapularis TaxID=6945 RepID=B7P7Y2_IXOSC|nr:hypothetical protein IscW_ISCW017074 [Ixodes scapularis]|eukprot:XP_002400192.1 hypothetical protein IscW_ISCW017074 [Ixodes scapularis]
MDAFTENMLPGCLRLLDSLPDTVYRVCDLLGAVVARNGSAWRDQMLACLLQEVRTTVTALLEVAGREEVPQAERASQLSNLPEANMAAVRIHLFTLLFELVDAAQRVLVLPVPPKEPPATPKWLVSLVLLVDLYEKASVASKRRAPLLQSKEMFLGVRRPVVGVGRVVVTRNVYAQLPKRQWKWFDDRTGRWSTYQPQNNKAIDEAYCAVEPSVHFTAGRRKYTVQFSTMVQINEETGNWRPVMLAWDGKSSTPPPPATSTGVNNATASTVAASEEGRNRGVYCVGSGFDFRVGCCSGCCPVCGFGGERGSNDDDGGCARGEEDDSRYTSANAVQILKYVAAKAPSSPPPVGGVVAQVMSDLLNVLPTPLPPTPPPQDAGAMDAVAGSLSDAGGASPSANGAAGAGGNGGVPGADLVREGSANDLLAQDEDPVPTLDPAGVEDGGAAAKDRSGPGSTGSRGGTPGPKEDKSQPLLPKSAVCRLLAELVRSYAPCARMVADHVYAAGQTELVPEEMSALGFILDHLLPQCQKAGDKDSPALARVLVAALASANHSPDTQTALVNEVKGALHRALALPEGTEKHARIQALTGLVGTMIESCPPAQATSSFRQLHASMNNMVRVLLRRGLVTDLARIPHSLDLSSPHMAATVNSALKPLETLSRIVNLPAQGAPGTPRGAGRKGSGQGAGSQGVAGLGGGSARTPLQLASHEEGHEDEEDPRDGRENGGPPELERESLVRVSAGLISVDGAGSQGVAGLGGGSARTPLQLASHEEGHEDEEDPRDGRENGGPPELEPIGSQNAEMSSSDATNAYGDATVDDNTDSEYGTLSARAELALRETEEEHDSQMIARDMISRDSGWIHREVGRSGGMAPSVEYQDLEEALFRMQDRDDNLFFHFEEVFPSSGTSIMFGGSEGIRTYQLPIVPDESNNGAETSSPSIPPPPGTVASTHPLLVRHGDPQGGGPSSRLHRRPRGYRAQGTAHGAGPGGSGTWHVYANRHPNPPAILQRLLGPNTAQDILQLTSTFNPVASSTAQTRVVFANSDFRILATDEDLFEIQVQ